MWLICCPLKESLIINPASNAATAKDFSRYVYFFHHLSHLSSHFDTMCMCIVLFLASNYSRVNDSQPLIDRVHSKTHINQRSTIIHAWIRLMGICTFRIWIIQKYKWLRNIFIFDRWAPIPPWMESSIANLILSSFSRNRGISARILVKLLFLVLHFFSFWINSGYFLFFWFPPLTVFMLNLIAAKSAEKQNELLVCLLTVTCIYAYLSPTIWSKPNVWHSNLVLIPINLTNGSYWILIQQLVTGVSWWWWPSDQNYIFVYRENWPNLTCEMWHCPTE